MTAAGAALDPALLDQLAEGGTLVAPVGEPGTQDLLRIRKTPEGVLRENLGKVAFVPLLPGIL